LLIGFQGTGLTPLLLTHASVPARLPALVAGSLPSGSARSSFDGLGLDGVSRAMAPAGCGSCPAHRRTRRW
jgi:hypothetical protein